MRSEAGFGAMVWVACLSVVPAAGAGAQGRETPATGVVTATSTLSFRQPPPESAGPYWRPLFWGLPIVFGMPTASEALKPVNTPAVGSAAIVPAASATPVEPSSIQPLRQSAPARTAASARGRLRLRVTPVTAQVYVDGFYAGTAEEALEQADGLNVTAGWHRLEFRAPGHETLAVNVTVEIDRAVTWQGELRPVRD